MLKFSEFYQMIDRFFEDYHFIKQENKYTRQIVNVEPGMHIVMNGVPHTMPGKERIIDYVCELLGQGHVDHGPGRDIEHFEHISYSIYIDGSREGGISECIYYDDHEYFKRRTMEIFNLR